MGILFILKKNLGLILSNKYILFLALKLYFILKLIFLKIKVSQKILKVLNFFNYFKMEPNNFL